MNFSLPMKIAFGLIAALVVLKVMTPSVEQQYMEDYNQQSQQMIEQMNQQSQALQMQSMQMLNDMQGYATPYQNVPNVSANPGYYQQAPGYPNGQQNYESGNQGYYAQSSDNWNW